MTNLAGIRGRWRVLRRRMRNDSGAVLIFALLIITTISLVATAVLLRGSSALKVGVALRSVAASTYQADAAGNVVVNDLRTGFQDPANGVTLSGNNPADAVPGTTPWKYNNNGADGCFGQNSTAPTPDGTTTLTGSGWRAYVVCKGELGTGNQGSHTVVTTQNRPKFAVETLLPSGTDGSRAIEGSLDLRSTYGVGTHCSTTGTTVTTASPLATALTTTGSTTTIRISSGFSVPLYAGTPLTLTYKTGGVTHTQTFVISVDAASGATSFTVKPQTANYAYPRTNTTVSYEPVSIYLQGDLGVVGNLCPEGPVSIVGGSVYAGRCYTPAPNTITLDTGPLPANNCINDASTVADPGIGNHQYDSLLQVDDDGNPITPTIPTLRTIPPAGDTTDLAAGGFLANSANGNTDCRSTSSKQVFTLKPGSYESVAGLNSLTSDSSCIVWFKPGVYYFDFRDANSTDDPEYMGAGGAVGWRITAGVVIGGGTTAPVPTPHSVTDYGSCPGPQEATINTSSAAAAQADADTAARQGVQFVFGGNSQMELSTVYGSSAGSGPQVDLCGRYSLQHPPIVLYGLKTDLGVPDTTGGSTSPPLSVSVVKAPSSSSPSQVSSSTLAPATGSGTLGGSGANPRTWTLPSSSGSRTWTVQMNNAFAPTPASAPAGYTLVAATVYATYGYASSGTAGFAQPTISLTTPTSGGASIGALTLPANGSSSGTPSEKGVVLSAASNPIAFTNLKSAIGSGGFTGASATFVQGATGSGTSNKATFSGARLVLTYAKDTGFSATSATPATAGNWTAASSGATATWTSTSNTTKTLNLSGFAPTLPAGAVITGATVSVIHRESTNSAPTIGLSVGGTSVVSSRTFTANTSDPDQDSYTLTTTGTNPEVSALASAISAAGGNFSGLNLAFTQTLSGSSTAPATADVLGASIALSYTVPGFRPLTLRNIASYWHDTTNDPCEPGCGDNPTDSSLLLIDQRASNSTGAYVRDHNFEGKAYFEGMIYSPTADGRIGLPNANNTDTSTSSGMLGVADSQSFAGWGMVFRSAYIERPYSVPDQANGTPYLGTPWIGNGAGQDSTTVQFQVYLCSDMTSTCDATHNSKLALDARVQLLDNDRDTTQRSVNILSWSHQS